MIRIALAVVFLTAAAWALIARSAEPTHSAAPVRRAHWVMFDSVAAASDHPPALSAEALAHRKHRGIGIFPNDRPLPDSLLRLVAAHGARIRHVSLWLRAVSIDADARVLARLARHPAVREVLPVRRLQVASSASGAGTRFSASNSLQTDSAFYGPNWPAIRELGIPTAHTLGFNGRGIRIGILDTGFETAHEALAARQVARARDLVDDDANVSDRAGTGAQSRHGTQVWSIMGGFRPGTVVGPAYEAAFILAKVDAEPGDTGADEDRWVAGLELAAQEGAHIVNSSITFRDDFTDRAPIPYSQLDGNTTVTTRAADQAARRGIVLVVAMGNDGPASGSLHAPADADSVIAVGAVNALGSPAVFQGGASGRGPTSDGRIKPELSARGVGLIGASTPGLATYQTGLAGTSFSTALMTGAVAIFMQAWPELNAAAVRRAVLLAGRRTNRDNEVGAGVPDIAAAILFPEGISNTRVEVIDQDDRLATIAPRFVWTAPLVHSALRPVLYRVEIARDPVFDDIVHTDTVREAFALTLRQPLRPAQALWWRVVATGRLNVRRASVVSGPISMPNWVRLVSPVPTRVTFVDSVQPTLSWTPLEAPAPLGPFTYQVQVISAETGQLVQPAIHDLETSSVRVPLPLQANVAYRWRVIATIPGGAADTAESASPFVVTSVTRPPATLLYQNFPNPFPRTSGETTSIWFDLAERSTVELSVFDLRARLVRTLIPANAGCGTVTLDAGQYGRENIGTDPDPCALTTWNGTDQNGAAVPRGVYILRLRADGRVEYRRIVFLGRG